MLPFFVPFTFSEKLKFVARSLWQKENITFALMVKFLRTAFLTVTCVGGFFVANAQEITVKDKISQQPIPQATVFSTHPRIKLLADVNGRFHLERFKGADTVYITYSSYEVKAFSYQELTMVVGVELADEHLSISEMTVTANRWEQDKVHVPGKIAKLRLREAELIGPQTAADLLETSGYVFVQKSQLAGGSPQLRGFGTNRVMIVVDGVRMNNAIFRSGNLQNVISLDGNSLESAEVLFGPGAVIYGSDAIGGVMDFRTKEARFSADTSKLFTRTNLFGRYSTASNETTGHADVNIGLQKWAFMTAVTYSQFGDLRAGSNGNAHFLRPTYQTQINGVDTTLINGDPQLQIHSGYHQINAIQKVSYRPDSNWTIDYGFNYSTTGNAPRYDRLTLDKGGDGVLDNAEWYYGPQKWMMHRLALSSGKETALYSHLRATAAYQNYQESRHDRKTGSSRIRRQFEKVEAISLNLDFDKEFKSETALFYGIEGVFNAVGSNAYREEVATGEQTIINSRYPNGSTWQAYGAYLNVKYPFRKHWTLNAGTRYSYYSISAQFDTTLFAFPTVSTQNDNGALNGSLGIVYNPNDHFQAYLNTSTGFRAPNIDDIGKVFDSEPGSVIVPNVDLKPEYAYNGEVGFVWVIKNKIKLDAAGYYTYLRNALARANYTFNGQDSIVYESTLSRVQAVQNVSDANVYGVQAGFEWAFAKGWAVRSTISWQKGFEFNVDSAAYFPKSHVAPLFGRTTLSYMTRRLKISAYAIYQGQMDFDDLPLRDRGDPIFALDANGNSFTPSWYTLNVKMAYYFNNHLSTTVGVENITDQLYRTFGSGISAPGRNFTVSVKATF